MVKAEEGDYEAVASEAVLIVLGPVPNVKVSARLGLGTASVETLMVLDDLEDAFPILRRPEREIQLSSGELERQRWIRCLK